MSQILAYFLLLKLLFNLRKSQQTYHNEADVNSYHINVIQGEIGWDLSMKPDLKNLKKLQIAFNFRIDVQHGLNQSNGPICAM